jgi:hypothetical protein
MVERIRPCGWRETKRNQSPSQSGVGQIPIARQTIEALQKIGLLDDVIVTKEGLVVYPTRFEVMAFSRTKNSQV